MSFVGFRDDLKAHFDKMCKGSKALFTTDVDVEELYNLYLDSYAEGDNPVFRERREHDCSACRHFIKQVGGLVTIKDGKVTTMWDFTPTEKKYKKVAKALSDYVRRHKVNGIYMATCSNVGTEHNNEIYVDADGKNQVRTWTHFHVMLPRFAVSRQPDTDKSGLVTGKQVFKRALDEISLDAVDSVLELVDSNTLYRGRENRSMIKDFRDHKVAYEALSGDDEKDLYAWEKSVSAGPAASRIRNTSIGTLLVNLSEGMDLDRAVTQYESITAPANYRRPKAVFTQKMLDDARQKITELGYMESLPRRFATLSDITVRDTLFVDRNVSKKVFGTTEAEGLFGDMEKSIPVSAKKFSRAEEIGIDDFVSKVLPTASHIELLLESRLSKNMVSLIAPKNKDAKSMFKWNNPFSWAYAGNMTDSALKQNVKNAGGAVDGVLRFSIQWNDQPGEFDRNDEDAHCKEPTGHIYYGCKNGFPSGGNLDIDIIHPTDGVPAVENITWPDKSRMKPGDYRFWVNCYSARGGRTGFRAEIEFDGQIYSYDYDKPLRQSEDVLVATVHLDTNGNFSITETLDSTASSRAVWGLNTNQFVPVSIIVNSPNHWDGEAGIGAKHTFFMLDGCVNTETPNPFFNEFLRDELGRDHKRVMEALAFKAHVEDSEDQLSGVGFSHTQRGEVTVKVHGATERVLKVKF